LIILIILIVLIVLIVCIHNLFFTPRHLNLEFKTGNR